VRGEESGGCALGRAQRRQDVQRAQVPAGVPVRAQPDDHAGGTAPAGRGVVTPVLLSRIAVFARTSHIKSEQLGGALPR
jgi:hypothetical protein